MVIREDSNGEEGDDEGRGKTKEGIDSKKGHDILTIMMFRWIGEKYDGVRICWNPVRSKLYQICCFVLFCFVFFFVLFCF